MAKKPKTLDEKSLRDLENDMHYAITALETWGGKPDSIDLAIKIPQAREKIEEAIAEIIKLNREMGLRSMAPAFRCDEEAA